MLVIHFYFEDTSFIKYTKGVIFGLTEFIGKQKIITKKISSNKNNEQRYNNMDTNNGLPA